MSRQPAAEVVLPVFVLSEEPESAVLAEPVAAPAPMPSEEPEAPPRPCVASPHVEDEATPRDPVSYSEAIRQEERLAEEQKPHVPEPLTVAEMAPLQSPLEPEAIPAAPAVVQPEPLAGNRPPIYPAAARWAGYEGVVILRVALNACGRVTEANVAASSGHPVLDDAASRAVRKWRFRPGMKNGRAVENELLVPIRFSLRKDP